MVTSKVNWCTLAIAFFGLVSLVLGVWMVADPDGFQSAVGRFGTINEHLVRDLATFTLALGAVLTVATIRASWRLPVLWFANGQNALHLVNHLADADQAEPLWPGMANVWALLAIEVVLAVLLVVVARPARPRPPARARRHEPNTDRSVTEADVLTAPVVRALNLDSMTPHARPALCQPLAHGPEASRRRRALPGCSITTITAITALPEAPDQPSWCQELLVLPAGGPRAR